MNDRSQHAMGNLQAGRESRKQFESLFADLAISIVRLRTSKWPPENPGMYGADHMISMQIRRISESRMAPQDVPMQGFRIEPVRTVWREK